MAKLKSERHHWWPESVSRHWADHGGGVHWLLPDGEIKRATPNNFGVIGNGHHIKLSNDPNKPSPWDESFEAEFQRADNNFPTVIEWLEGLKRADPSFERPIASRILKHQPTDEQFANLVECLVSLAVRSPMHRNLAMRAAEDFRGAIEPKEQNSLVGLNIRYSLRTALKHIGGRGKAMVLFSPDREFVFGDGFFNNLTPPLDRLHNPKMLVPITPRISVLFVRPSSYLVEPRLVTVVVSKEEANLLNHAVQIYAKDFIFYRTDRPEITVDFVQAKHLIFSDHQNPIDDLIHQIPGIPPRDTSLDWLLDR